MLSIDLTAVGSWAERSNVVYGSTKVAAIRSSDILEKHGRGEPLPPRTGISARVKDS
jgi:hypothetical protein